MTYYVMLISGKSQCIYNILACFIMFEIPLFCYMYYMYNIIYTWLYVILILYCNNFIYRILQSLMTEHQSWRSSWQREMVKHLTCQRENQHNHTTECSISSMSLKTGDTSTITLLKLLVSKLKWNILKYLIVVS